MTKKDIPSPPHEEFLSREDLENYAKFDEIKKAMPMKQPHKLEFKHSGKAGDLVTLSQKCAHLFRGTKLIIEEISEGIGTCVMAARVNGKNQFPPNPDGIPSVVFGPTARYNELLLDTLRIGDPFEIDLKFMRDCEVSITVEGEIALDK
jgi:hypothetical protein